MRLDILKNEKKSNHLNCLEKISTQADTLIIVSPFVADDISKLLNNISTIKKITLYTTLQKYDDTARKAGKKLLICQSKLMTTFMEKCTFSITGANQRDL